MSHIVTDIGAKFRLQPNLPSKSNAICKLKVTKPVSIFWQLITAQYLPSTTERYTVHRFLCKILDIYRSKVVLGSGTNKHKVIAVDRILYLLTISWSQCNHQRCHDSPLIPECAQIAQVCKYFAVKFKSQQEIMKNEKENTKKITMTQ